MKTDDNLNQLQLKLKKSLKKKNFLIILDDVWNDLINVFVQGDVRSKIIVRTLEESVALIIGSEVINIGTLSDEASWDLFKYIHKKTGILKNIQNLKRLGNKF